MLAEGRTRLTYLMLFRVGVVTLLLVATFMSELAGPPDQAPALRTTVLFGLIAATYGLTIVWAVWLKRGGSLERLAVAQIVADLLLTTMVVWATGGPESGFAFMYLLCIVSSSFVLPRGALSVASAAVVLYALAAVLRPANAQPLRDVLRITAINAVAFAATGMLAARLSVELSRARERIASQGVRLRDLAAVHKDVIRCLTSGLVTVTRDGTVITYNQAAADILGLSAEQAVGRSIDEVLPSLRPLLGSVAAQSQLRRGEVVHRGAGGGERILGVSLSPLVDSEGTVLGRIVNFQDLTELRRMEEAMTRAERLAAIGRLAAGVAHEIRNPLAAISGSIELLSQTTAQKEDQALMAIVLREVERLNTLITDLLDFARPRAPDPQRLELGQAISELLRVVENDRTLKGARVELRAGPAVWVDADAGQLRQVAWNLLRNAAEASPEGEPIVVEVAAETAGEHAWARLSVRDHGPGIAPELCARVFEPFYSTKEGGTGLGLATVHRIIDEHQGRIEIGNAPGGGALVTVRLPLREAAAISA